MIPLKSQGVVSLFWGASKEAVKRTPKDTDSEEYNEFLLQLEAQGLIEIHEETGFVGCAAVSLV